jgi:uncharacterized protein
VIIEQQIVPAFRQGDYDTGVLNGTAVILKTLGWDGDAPALQPVAPRGGGPDYGSLAFFGFVVVFILLRGLFGRRRPGVWGRRSRGGYWMGGGGWGGGSGGSFGGGGFSGGGGSFGGGGATGRW